MLGIDHKAVAQTQRTGWSTVQVRVEVEVGGFEEFPEDSVIAFGIAPADEESPIG